MAIAVLILFATGFLAYSNGANDNFKGVATLFGSHTTSYTRALRWATLTTFAGSAAAIFLAEGLVQRFSGKGLVPDALTTSPAFLLAVALAAATTVILATLLGFPVSTTHGLTGALVGAGLVAVGSQVNVPVLGSTFVLPLLLSPVVAVVMASGAYGVLHYGRVWIGVPKEACLCVGALEPRPSTSTSGDLMALTQPSAPRIALDIGHPAHCTARYRGHVLGVTVQQLLDGAHFLSAGLVSFARGLNDTPKIVAVLLATRALGVHTGMLVVASAMAVGGLLQARKVAATMSTKITPLTPGQGFAANLVTGTLVVAASRLALPVSTTHVAVGSVFGIGVLTRQANIRVIVSIVLSWVLTLPIAALLSGGLYWLFQMVGSG